VEIRCVIGAPVWSGPEHANDLRGLDRGIARAEPGGMASFGFISDLLAATCRVLARAPGSLVVEIGDQRLALTRLEVDGLEWLRVAAPVGPEALIPHHQALRHGARPWGSLALDGGGDYVLAHVLPLAGVEVAIVARVAMALAAEAGRLRREARRPVAPQTPFAGYSA
jgi:hypothetical protein